MKLRIVCIGKTRNPHLAALCDDYLQRIQHFSNCDWVVLRDGGRTSKPFGRDDEKRVLDKIAESPCSILLDLGAKELDSTGFAERIQAHRMRGTRQVDFLAAGPWGWTERIRAAATERLTLSRLTLPHELARVVLLEQIYRALARIHGTPYDK